MTTADCTPGNYRFLPYAFQYSSGVAALPGYEIERVQFRRPVPLMQGFERIEIRRQHHVMHLGYAAPHGRIGRKRGHPEGQAVAEDDDAHALRIRAVHPAFSRIPAKRASRFRVKRRVSNKG